MEILSEVSRAYILESITAPIGVSHFWSFNSHMMDFKLEELQYLEETTGHSVKLRIQNLDIILPASWYIMAVDKETYTIDSIPVTSSAAFDHNLLLFSPDDSKLVTTTATIVDYFPKEACVHPAIPKGAAMVQPTGMETLHGKSIFYGIVCGPHDLHRWIGGKTVGDILG